MGKQIVQYATVTARNDTELVDGVKLALSQGLEPLGGPVFLGENFYAPDQNGVFFKIVLLQAVVRYEQVSPRSERLPCEDLEALQTAFEHIDSLLGELRSRLRHFWIKL